MLSSLLGLHPNRLRGTGLAKEGSTANLALPTRAEWQTRGPAATWEQRDQCLQEPQSQRCRDTLSTEQV